MSTPPSALAGIGSGGILNAHLAISSARLTTLSGTGSLQSKIQAALASPNTAPLAHVAPAGGLIASLTGGSGLGLGGTGTPAPAATDAIRAPLSFK